MCITPETIFYIVLLFASLCIMMGVVLFILHSDSRDRRDSCDSNNVSYFDDWNTMYDY